MKGRLTTEAVNTFIGTVNSVLKKKYSIVNLKRREVKQKDIIQYTSWKNQVEEYKMQGNISIFQEFPDLSKLIFAKILTVYCYLSLARF